MDDLPSLKREVSRERLRSLFEATGLSVQRGEAWRAECPMKCGGDNRSVKIDDSEAGAVWHCHHCNVGGSALDLLMEMRCCDLAEALGHLRDELGRPLPDRASARGGKRGPRDRQRLWDALAPMDLAGYAYLKARGLAAAADTGLVKFNVGKLVDGWFDHRAREGYRVVMPLYDPLTGQLRSFQLRAIGDSDPSKLSCPNDANLPTIKGLLFGRAIDAQTAPVVYITEGIADTLALQLSGVVVVGLPGVDQIRHCPSMLGALEGRSFILCPQNDPKHHKSELAFASLAKSMEKLGARVITLKTPSEFEDPADWCLHEGREEFTRAVLEAKDLQPRPLARVAGAVPGGVAGNAALAYDPNEADIELGATYASIVRILSVPDMREQVLGPGALEYDELALLPTIGRRQLLEQDISRLREMCERRFTDSKGAALKFTRGDIEQAVMQVALSNPFHPVVEYLKTLRGVGPARAGQPALTAPAPGAWDGVERIRYVCEEILNIAHPTPLELVLMRKWMISMVARAFEPGCRAREVLIFVGPQRKGKSGFFRGLVGNQWFSDTPIDIRNKDSYLQMKRVWCVEWAELDSMKRARDQNTVKSFVSAQADLIRRPYARAVESIPRSCLIVGTSNDQAIFSDPTGNTRFWIIGPITDRINFAKLAEWRDQLWAEAVAAYFAGEDWELSDEEEASLAEAQQEYEEADPWEEPIFELFEQQYPPEALSTATLLEKAIRKDKGQWTKADEMRIGSIMTAAHRSAGSKPKERRTVKGVRAWYWYPPPREARPKTAVQLADGVVHHDAPGDAHQAPVAAQAALPGLGSDPRPDPPLPTSSEGQES